MAPAEPARRRRRPSDGSAPARRDGSGTAAAMRSAVEQLSSLLGRVPESVSSLRPTEDGWEAQVEVLELERIPDTTSILGSYKVTLDEQGDLISYERTRRYSRGAIDRPT
ncbi:MULTISPECIES: gas vesicle protein [unclassified Streptomyces]|uniref:gas vesicle protein GvpO n=1 Tax=unclassified Streptomyces TaxID=2593676 RepID=UPI0033261034